MLMQLVFKRISFNFDNGLLADIHIIIKLMTSLFIARFQGLALKCNKCCLKISLVCAGKKFTAIDKILLAITLLKLSDVICVLSHCSAFRSLNQSFLKPKAVSKAYHLIVSDLYQIFPFVHAKK